jgi:hypothetical protein
MLDRCPLTGFWGRSRWFMAMNDLFIYRGIAWEKLNVQSLPCARETVPEIYRLINQRNYMALEWDVCSDSLITPLQIAACGRSPSSICA